MTGETCPKCDQPRLADSPDCPYCGIVYQRYRGPRAGGVVSGAGDGAASPGAAAGAAGDLWAGEPLAETGGDPAGAPAGTSAAGPGAGPPRPAATPAAGPAGGSTASGLGMPEVYGDPLHAGPGDVYSPAASAAAGGRVPRPDADSPRDGEETFLTRYMALSILVFLLVTVAMVGFWNREVFGLEEDLEMVRHGFTQLSGLPAPDGVNEGQLWRLAGRRLVFFQDADVPEDELGLLCFLYHPGTLGEEYDRSDLFHAIEARLRKLEVPYVPMGQRQIRVGGQTATQSTWRLGNQEVNVGTVAALAFRGRDDKTTLLVFVGKPGIVARQMRRMVL